MIARVPASPAYALTVERAVGWLLGAYLLSQCFSLPILRLGPSWALWPSLPDLLAWAAGLLSLGLRASLRSVGQRRVWTALLLLCGLCLVAFGLLFVMRDPALGSAVGFGLFQLFKLAQVLLVFSAVSRLRLDGRVLARWRWAATLALLITVGTVAWSSFSGTLPQALGQLLPHGAVVSGPWEAYYKHNETGLGMIGYNHGYVAVQLLLMGALVLMLSPGRSGLWVLLLSLAACFLTGSRAGLAGALIFALWQWRQTPVKAGVWLVGLLLLGLALLPLLPQLGLDSLTSRQATILDAENADNLSGRNLIWAAYQQALLSDPWRMLVGSGFGSAINNGGNAHFLPLQILYETGLAGLCAASLFFTVLVRALRQARAQVLLSLLLGLAFTALTQETFYPTPAFSGFLPLLAFAVALALGLPPAAQAVPAAGAAFQGRLP